MKLGVAILALAALSATSAPRAQAASRPPEDIAEFVGVRAGKAEEELKQLGYEAIKTVRGKAFWWNAGTKVCARIVTSNGRFRSIEEVSEFQCDQ